MLPHSARRLTTPWLVAAATLIAAACTPDDSTNPVADAAIDTPTSDRPDASPSSDSRTNDDVTVATDTSTADTTADSNEAAEEREASTDAHETGFLTDADASTDVGVERDSTADA